ncbi:MAG: leucine-rich repeat protein, partial [Clostridia bacterium]|nr:leucine-rich repeat protein [Clostridia bacterium]
VTSIGSFAFYNCSLTSVTIPDSVTSIGGSAFENCTSLTSVNIGNSVTSIEDYAFCDCTSLTSVTIPDSVTSIGITAFYDCSSLTSIEVSEKNQNYSSVDGVLFNKAKTELICYPEGKTNKDYTIPDSVTSIGWCAFSYCTSLTSVTIPDSVTSIGYRAFDDCDSLKTVYYRGSENDRKNITIDSYNEDLTNATWYYNSCIGSAEHNFDSYNICTVCGDKKYVIGDCNGDYNVDTTDLAVLKLNLAGIGELSDTGKLGADLNGDGSIDTTDLAKLKLKLAGIE